MTKHFEIREKYSVYFINIIPTIYNSWSKNDFDDYILCQFIGSPG